jgi:hypothetical protein
MTFTCTATAQHSTRVAFRSFRSFRTPPTECHFYLILYYTTTEGHHASLAYESLYPLRKLRELRKPIPQVARERKL